jgi:hypothetical protein
MRNYWLKIAGGMLLVFVVGYAIHAAVGRAKGAVESSHDITIPLGSVVAFRIDGQELGRLRSITLLRSAERQVDGIRISVRTSDTAAFARLAECRLTVQDPENIDPSSSFLCLPSDSGYTDFGELRVSLRENGTTRTVTSRFLLPDSAIRQIRERREGAVGVDREAIRAQARAHADSVRAAAMDEQAEELKRRADSIRQRRAGQTPTLPVPPGQDTTPA